MKRFAVLMLALVLVFSCTAALAQQQVDCPVGGFSLVLPDQFREGPLDPVTNPELCLYWYTRDNSLSIQAYASYLGEIAFSDLFQVLDGSEKVSGELYINDMRMMYARTETSILYSWMDRGNNVTIYFIFTANDPSVLNTVDEIMSSITFDAGH